MRLSYLLLVAVAGLLTSSEAASINYNTAGTSPMSSDTTHTRFLRSARTTSVDSIKGDDEERAVTIAGGHIRDSAQTKQWLNSLLQQGKSLDDVKLMLGMKGLSLDKMTAHMNWNAFARYQRMSYERDTNSKIPYAVFGSELQTKKSTLEVFQGWAMTGISVKRVGKFLGVWGLPRSEQLIHTNWNAFKAYQKMFAQYRAGMQKIRDQTHFAFYDKSYRGFDEVEETLSKWAMFGFPIENIATTLGVAGLSGAKLKNHMNYRAFQMYVRNFNAIQALKEANAKAEAGTAALAKARATARNA